MAAIPKPLALALRDMYGLKYAVETGTWKMWSTEWLAANFEKVWTIEMDQGWYDRAVARVADIPLPNVQCLLGDSRVKLRAVLMELDGPALLWLDAHWCGGAVPDSPPEFECPLREELLTVRDMVNSGPHRHFVLIDDAEYFMGRPRYPHRIEHWPSLTEIISKLPSGYLTNVWQNTIISVPGYAQGIVMAWMLKP